MRRTITVKIFGNIRYSKTKIKNNIYYLNSDREITVKELVRRLGIPAAGILVIVNDAIAHENQLIRAGEEVRIYPILGGG